MSSMNVESEITGKVWKIVAPAGTRVEEEGTIVVIESMKMEIAVTAPRAGVVTELLVAEGDAVLEGQTVARLNGAA